MSLQTTATMFFSQTYNAIAPFASSVYHSPGSSTGIWWST